LCVFFCFFFGFLLFLLFVLFVFFFDVVMVVDEYRLHRVIVYLILRLFDVYMRVKYNCTTRYTGVGPIVLYVMFVSLGV
jgi:hypothetical protein